MESSLVAGGREKPKKIICETIKRNLDFNGLNADMIYDRLL